MAAADVNKYAPVYPTDVAIDNRLKHFIRDFYAASDDIRRNEEWVTEFFAPDATLLIRQQKAGAGLDAMREFREAMWKNVKSRRHKLDRVYPASFHPKGSSAAATGRFEYMITGSLEMELQGEEGDDEMQKKKNVEALWSARAVVEDFGGKLKYTFYHVYMG